MKTEEIFITVRQVISESCGIAPEKIKLESTLFSDLNIDSIDLVDVLFQLETAYDLPLQVIDIEKRVRQDLGNDKPFEIEGVLTTEGLAAAKQYMDEIPADNFRAGLTIHELVIMFRVHSLCKLIEYKLEESKKI